MKKSRLNLGVSPGASWEKKELCEVYELGMGKTLKSRLGPNRHTEERRVFSLPSRDQAIRLLAPLKIKGYQIENRMNGLRILHSTFYFSVSYFAINVSFVHLLIDLLISRFSNSIFEVKNDC